jgi:hypothetical protein
MNNSPSLFHGIRTMPRCLLALLLPFSSLCAQAFTVTKDIHSTRPLDEKWVIFEKGKPSGHLSFTNSEDCAFSLAKDGSLECKLAGSSSGAAVIHWKAGNGLPPSFRSTDYDYLVVVCRIEGSNITKGKKGEGSEQRNDTFPGFGFALFNDQGEIMAQANPAMGAENLKLPEKTETLKIPIRIMFFWHPEAAGEVDAIGIRAGATKAGTERNYRFVIDKISLANATP